MHDSAASLQHNAQSIKFLAFTAEGMKQSKAPDSSPSTHTMAALASGSSSVSRFSHSSEMMPSYLQGSGGSPLGWAVCLMVRPAETLPKQPRLHCCQVAQITCTQVATCCMAVVHTAEDFKRHAPLTWLPPGPAGAAVSAASGRQRSEFTRHSALP